jgi:hypothetical protein
MEYPLMLGAHVLARVVNDIEERLPKTRKSTSASSSSSSSSSSAAVHDSPME